ncbi:MAG: MFS transporter [Desulfovibrionaceae bacterium]|nr:MFS transporter [Desulfovibrionaceae bacterium]
MNQHQEHREHSAVAITMAICLIYAINGGVRGNFGTLLGPIAESSGLSYGDVSFVLATSQLLFGLLQPAFGILALRTSERFVLVLGVLLMAASFLLTPFCHAMWSLGVTLGVLLPAGTAALSFGLLLGIAAGQLPPSRSASVSGFLNASSGLGTTVLAPVLQALAAAFGLLGAMLFLGLPSLMLLPLAFWLCRGRKARALAGKDAGRPESGRAMIGHALKSRSYIYLLTGFFTCGFHMAILETHFFNQLVTFDFSRETSSFVFAVYGVLTMIGSAAAGMLCTKYSMKRILGSLYAVRVLLACVILVMPASLALMLPFVVVLGLTSDSTVSPTAGLILREFGPAKLPTLFGLAFLTHQVGCFASAWLGGILAEATGGYTALWVCDGLLSALAATVSFMVREDEMPAQG